MKMNYLKAEIQDLIKHFDKFTTSDLQGVCMALGLKYGVSQDSILNTVYEGVGFHA